MMTTFLMKLFLYSKRKIELLHGHTRVSADGMLWHVKQSDQRLPSKIPPAPSTSVNF